MGQHGERCHALCTMLALSALAAASASPHILCRSDGKYPGNQACFCPALIALQSQTIRMKYSFAIQGRLYFASASHVCKQFSKFLMMMLQGDIILVGLRDYQDEKADVILK